METYPAIPVRDDKGEDWLLGYSGMVHESRLGLIEGWWFVLEGPPFLNENGSHYDTIPLPIFTEWFYD